MATQEDQEDDALSSVELQLEHLHLHDEPSTSMKGENVERTTCTLMSIALQKIKIGEAWAERCRIKAAATENAIEGMSKLARRIETEAAFLKKLIERDPGAALMGATKLDQVRSSNLGHLQALAHAAFTLANVTAVLHAMPCVVSGYGRQRLVVDVVANSGQTFVKVVASNRRTSTLMTTQPHPSDDDRIEDAEEVVNRFGERTLVHQLNDYVACSEQNPVFHRPPSVEVVFYVRRNVQLPSELASSMSKKVTVRTVDEDVALTSLPPPPPPPSGKVNLLLEDHHCPSELLNLDVSCMIAYVSALTNGRANFLFAEAVLTEQAGCERRCPVKPKLDAWFKGRELVSCRTAIDGFKKIVATVGGKGEKERAIGLLERVRVVEDVDDGHWTTSPLVYKLRLQSQEDRGRKMKLRSLVIFGTGEALRAVTVTANRGFVRSAESKGVRLAVLLHESRALTEAKEATGKEIAL